MLKKTRVLRLFLCSIFALTFGLSSADAQTHWYVNDNSQTNDVFTTAVGNDANAGTVAAPFATVAKAISSASTGDTIWVDVRNYTSNFTINKSVAVVGPNHDKLGNDNTRGAEAVLDQASIALSGSGANGSSLNGFKIVRTNSTASIGGTNGAVWLAGNNTGAVRNNYFLKEGTGNGIEAIIVSGGSGAHIIEGNYFHSTSLGTTTRVWNHGVWVVGSNPTKILNNTFGKNRTASGSSDDMGAAVILEGGNNDVLIKNNDLSGNATGVFVWDNSAGGTANLNNTLVEDNNLAGNTTFFNNGRNVTLETSCNWYGTAAKPAASQVIGDVEAVMFLVAATSSTTLGFIPTANCTGPVTVWDLSDNFVAAYGTIQSAIDDVTTLAGYTVKVSEGTYPEAVTIGSGLNGLKLIGSVDANGVPNSIINPGSLGGGVSTDGSEDLVIKNFEITGSTGRGIIVKNADGVLLDNLNVHHNNSDGIRVDKATNATVQNCISDNNKVGLIFYALGEVKDNVVSNAKYRGIYIVPGSKYASGNVLVSGNEVFGNWTDHSFTEWRTGGIIYYDNGKKYDGHVTIENNVTYDNYGPGINIYKLNESETTGLTLKVSGNTSYGNMDALNRGNGDGIVLYLSNYIDVENNTVYDNDNAGIRISNDYHYNSYFPTSNNTLTGNIIYGNERGVYVQGNNTHKIDGIVINENLIYNNTIAGLEMSNNGAEDIDASCNWWGQNTGSVTGDILITNGSTGLISSLPYVSDSTDNLPATPGFQPKNGACAYPVWNITQSKGYMLIQDGVDDATAGDSLELREWVFEENVLINKSLTIVGDSTKTRDKMVLDGSSFTNKKSAIQVASNVKNVTLANFTIQNYSGNNGNSTAGIYATSRNDGLEVYNVEVKEYNNMSGFYANGPVKDIVIDGSSFVNTSPNTGSVVRGIVIWNGLKENITFTNNTVSNNNCCGIELQDGDASGVLIKGNTINALDNAIGVVGLAAGSGPNIIDSNIINVKGRFGIELRNSEGTGNDNPTEDGAIIISKNIVTHLGGLTDVRDIAGISVYRRAVTSSSNNPDIPSGVVIKGNTVSGFQQTVATSNSTGFGIVVEGVSHIIKDNNVSVNNDIGIQVQAGHDPTSYPGDANQNDKNDDYFGRGNSPIACGITILNNNLGSGSVSYIGASAAAGLIQNTNTGKIYCSIQAAIDDPLTLNSHTIVVGEGTYTETISVNKAVTLRGPNYNKEGTDNTRVAEAVLENCTVTISGAGPAVLEGFKVYNTNAPSNAVFVSGATTTATIQNNIFERESTTTGNFVRAISINPSTSGDKIIKGNLFTGEESGVKSASTHKSWRGAIWLNGGKDIYVTDNTFKHVNTGINADGLNADIVIKDNVFEENGTHIAVGGPSPLTGPLTLDENEFEIGYGTSFNLSNVDTSFRLDVTSSTFNGKTSNNLTLSELFDVENTILHRGKFNRNGLVIYKANNEYVTTQTTGIQPAVNYARDGFTITIDAGTYSENVDVYRAITLIGAGSDASGTVIKSAATTGEKLVIQAYGGVSAAKRIELKSLRVSESGTGLRVGNHVTIDDVQSIDHSSYGIRLESSEDIVINNSKFNNNTSSGLKLPSTQSGSDWVVTNSEFNGNKYGWFADANKTAKPILDNIEVSNTTFNDNEVIGIYLNRLSNATFDSITVDNSGFDNTSGLRLAGIDLHLKYRTDYENILFRNSVISNSGVNHPDGAGIIVRARDDGSSYGADPAFVDNVRFENMYFTDNGGTGSYSSGIIIGHTQNGVSANNASPVNVTITNSSITGNSEYQLLNATDTTVVDANCNWWGSTSNTVFATGINGDADYSSWLTNGTDDEPSIYGFQPIAGACDGTPVVITNLDSTAHTCTTPGGIEIAFTGGTSGYVVYWSDGTVDSGTTATSPYVVSGIAAGTYTVWVKDTNGSISNSETVTVLSQLIENSTKSIFYATIQEAIDSATAGDVINVCAGIFNEELVIDKSLTLLGAQNNIDPRSVVSSTRSIGATVTESVLTTTGNENLITIKAENVIIDGFYFTQTGAGSADAIITNGSYNNLQVLNNIFTSTKGGAVSLNAGEGISVKQNYLYETAGDGISITGSSIAPLSGDNQEIIANEIYYPAGDKGAIYLSGTQNVDIKENVIKTKGNGVAIATNSGLMVKHVWIDHNDISTTLEGINGWAMGVAVDQNSEDIIVLNNKIYQTGTHSPTSNKDQYALVRVGVDASSDPINVVVKDNYFKRVDNENYIYVNASATQDRVDAMCNWFEDNDYNNVVGGNKINGGGNIEVISILTSDNNLISMPNIGFEPNSANCYTPPAVAGVPDLNPVVTLSTTNLSAPDNEIDMTLTLSNLGSGATTGPVTIYITRPNSYTNITFSNLSANWTVSVVGNYYILTSNASEVINGGADIEIEGKITFNLTYVPTGSYSFGAIVLPQATEVELGNNSDIKIINFVNP